MARFTIKAHLIGPWKWIVWDAQKRTEAGFHEHRKDAKSQATRLNETQP